MLDLLDAFCIFVLASLGVGAWLRDHHQTAARVEPRHIYWPEPLNRRETS
jgi:hypothetical protein